MHHSLKKIIAVLCFSITTASSSFAKDSHYYSDDLDDAILAAKKNPVNEEFVGARWYNRSTSRSFDFPKMMNAEMDKEVIEGAMGPTAAGEAAAAEAQQPVTDAALDRKSQANSLEESQADSMRNKKINATTKVSPPRENYIGTVNSQPDYKQKNGFGSTTIRDVRGRPLETKGKTCPGKCNPDLK